VDPARSGVDDLGYPVRPDGDTEFRYDDVVDWDQVVKRISESKDRFRENLIDWGCYCLPRHFKSPPADFHYSAAKMLRTAHRSVWIAPRWHAKSTIAVLDDPLYECLERDLVDEFFIIKASNPDADEWIGKIAFELETNEALQYLYGIRKGTTWRTTYPSELTFHVDANGRKKFCRILGRGWGRGYRGRHPQKVAADDLQDLNDVENPDLCARLDEWLVGTVMGGLPADARFGLSSTFMHPASVVSQYAGNGDERSAAEGWSAQIDSCVLGAPRPTSLEEAIAILENPKTKVSWPEARPREFLLQKLKTEFSTKSHLFILDFFSCEATGENILLPEAKVTELGAWRTPEQLSSGKLFLVGGIDPARGKRRHNDYSALGLIGLYLDGPDKDKVIVIDSRHKRVSGRERRDYVVDFILEWMPDYFIVEINKDSDLPILVEDRLREKKILVPIVSVEQPTDETKDDRIRDEFAAAFDGTMVFMDDLEVEAKRELFRFPSVAKKDQIDNIATLKKWLRENKHLAVRGRCVINDPDRKGRKMAAPQDDRSSFVWKNGELMDTMRDIDQGDSEREEALNKRSWEDGNA
jgi:hypothetical protein